MDRLEEIRERLAGGYLVPNALQQAARDVRDLIAEVERLQSEVEGWAYDYKEAT
jgi:outer membrane murein-binding lipoprotein Lpp